MGASPVTTLRESEMTNFAAQPAEGSTRKFSICLQNNLQL